MEIRRAEGVEGSLAELRGRLYRRDATAEDLRRYEARLAASATPETTPPESAAASAAPAAPGGARTVHRVLATTGIVGLLVAGALVGRLSAENAPSARVTAAAPALQEQEPDGLRWQIERPVRGERLRSDPTAQQFHGRGAADARLDTSALPRDGGRLEVLLTLEEDAPALWAATRVDTGPGSIVVVRVLAEWSGRQRRAVPVPVSFRYAGSPPTSVHVHVPHGVAWGLVVAPRR